MINNLELIKTLLKFDNPEEFYFVQVLQRSKENPELGKNNRLVKAYYIYSMEYLDKVFPEMVKMADVFNARVYIHLNRRNAKMIGFELMEDLAHCLKSEQYNSLDKAYNSACGRHHSDKDKSWVVDLDGEELDNLPEIKLLLNFIEPLDKEKIIAEIPTKNGLHLITRPFNSQKFGEKFPQVILHKNNPTILYSP